MFIGRSDGASTIYRTIVTIPSSQINIFVAAKSNWVICCGRLVTKEVANSFGFCRIVTIMFFVKNLFWSHNRAQLYRCFDYIVRSASHQNFSCSGWRINIITDSCVFSGDFEVSGKAAALDQVDRNVEQYIVGA